MKTFNSQICTTKEQSERLLALGLKKETADMALHFSYVDCDGNAYYIAYPIGHKCTGIPAWSLHRLLLLLPKEIRIERNFYTIAVVNDSIQIVDDCGDIYIHFMSMNVYGELIDCIAWLIKEGYFPKEYLQEQADSSREG